MDEQSNIPPKSEKELLLAYLDEVLQTQSAKLVGHIMKRFELIENKDVLKRDVRELVYESSRELRDIFYAYSKGLESFRYNFIKKNKE
jgi:hypothetical protein